MLTQRPLCRYTARFLVLTGLCFSASASTFVAQGSAESPQEQLIAVLGHHLADAGVWRQENPSHEPGSGTAVAWVKRYRWGLGRTIVLDETFALMEDGSCEQWAHRVLHWDIREQAVRGHLVHISGVWGTGLTRFTAKQQTTTEAVLVLPDGTESKIRDIADLSDPDQLVVRAHVASGANWSERPAVAWVHVSAPDKPCGL